MNLKMVFFWLVVLLLGSMWVAPSIGLLPVVKTIRIAKDAAPTVSVVGVLLCLLPVVLNGVSSRISIANWLLVILTILFVFLGWIATSLGIPVWSKKQISVTEMATAVQLFVFLITVLIIFWPFKKRE